MVVSHVILEVGKERELNRLEMSRRCKSIEHSLSQITCRATCFQAALKRSYLYLTHYALRPLVHSDHDIDRSHHPPNQK